ncbi:MAG: contractile injection system protein, VgrG/Pvc8 family [Pseudomonadota bacterium]
MSTCLQAQQQLVTTLGHQRLTLNCVGTETAIGQRFRILVSTLSTDAGTVLASLIGQPALLTASGRQARPLHAYITQVATGTAHDHLTLEPWTAYLAHGCNSRVFQHMTVFDILDCVFAPWQGKGRLAPCWRFEIGERHDYPIRSLTTQDQESDLGFAERLMSEEGLFHYFEHEGDPASPALGRHTMIIAEHDRSRVRSVRADTEPAFG